MQSHIKIKLKFKCIIGILDFERKKKQKIQIKLEAKSDDFLDYAQLVNHLKKIYKTRQFKLIEESLEELCHELKNLYPQIKFLKITLYKLKIIKKAKVGSSIERIY
ncbi:dihydroneopterin aldolase [Campylobacter sp. MIT 99-7217]|uniref:dihydroneopterin aldolase n=1 Tax=Campylobacter sp. MIT 99-7217 TaxID=535091 RepID=UPI001158A02B|nr:dihydroneopterin aldolase [Campylobacter sp. MIT 99-7217]TQR33113.1 dihydroneopterin aldolase [Campylobacter sp. MIT 99-7217]